MKTKSILLLILSIGIQTCLFAQQPFKKIDEIYGYVFKYKVSGLVDAKFDARYNTSFLPADKYPSLDLSQFKGRKIITLYKHVVDGLVKEPVGNIIITVEEENFPEELSYRRLGKSNLIIIPIINTSFTSLEEAYDQLKKKPWVKELSIDYIADIIRHADSYYPQQYYLKNTGQFGGTSGIDINVENAWALTKGNLNLTVAVIDDGLESHNDLKDESGTSRILDGYTPVNNGDGKPELSTDGHGIACAGILSASHNDDLIRGVAPKINLIAVNIFHNSTSNADIADGIIWAVDNGARILSNSWGYPTTHIVDPIDDAIDYAINNDVVVVFAAGNDGFVSFPGNYPGVVTVNSIDKDGGFWNYNGTSSSVELVAPSGDVNLQGDQFTLDREGSSGYSINDYMTTFGGTSGAAPQIAGAFALIYSVNPLLSISQAKSIIYNSAIDMGTAGKDISYGYGRLDVYSAVKAAMPQFTNHQFSSTTITSGYMALNGSSSLANGATLTIAEDHAIVISGNLSSTGSSSSIVVEGTLILEKNATLNNIELSVEDGAVFIAEDNTTVIMSTSQLFTINGTARFGDGFHLKNPGVVKVASTGSIEFLGDATLEFTESAATPPLYAYGYMEIRGEVLSAHASNETVTLRLSSASSAPGWGGINVYNTALGSLKNLRIEDATTGITLSSVSHVSLSNVEIVAPSFAGISSSSSSFLASNIFVTDSGNKGILISGGSPEIDYVEVTGSGNSGLHAGSYSNTYIGEGEITGSGGGASSAGVWVNNASYTHVNGYNGPNNGWDVRAENYAWVWFNGTYWDGSPYSSVDGTSTLSIQNPNNPQKSLPSPPITAQAQLLKDWAERYRESPEQAAEWLRNKRTTLTSKLDAVAAIMLADYHLSQGNYAQVKTLLGEVPDHAKAQVEPGAFALRNLQLALNAVKDKALAYQSLQALHQAHMEPQMLAHYTFMVRQRYGDEDSKELTAQTTPEKHPALFNYPNPFNPVTTISYHLPTNSQVSLKVYDLLGREVAALLNERKEAGSYTVRFDASQLSSGLYLYRLQTEEHIITSRMTLIK